MHVLNLNNALDYPLDGKMMDSRNSEALSLPLKVGPLAICSRESQDPGTDDSKSSDEEQKTAETLNAVIAFNRKIRGTPTPQKREGGNQFFPCFTGHN